MEITLHPPREEEARHATNSDDIGDDRHWFKRLPIHKRTNVRLEVTLYTQKLFRRRSRMSRLRFRVPDVSLDRERVADIRQTCADLGFQIYAIRNYKSPDEYMSEAQLEGIRNKSFYDIHLFARITRTSPQQLSRELRYRQRTDSKTIPVSMLDINIWLWGSGDDTTEEDTSPHVSLAEEIASLHVDLYDILSQRLHYLHTE
jgi:hypothetical protein